MGRDGLQDVDIVLTTRELGRLIRRRNIDFKNLSPMEPFGDLAKYTGAAAIFWCYRRCHGSSLENSIINA